jgi:hypothetical protein
MCSRKGYYEPSRGYRQRKMNLEGTNQGETSQRRQINITAINDPFVRMINTQA